MPVHVVPYLVSSGQSISLVHPNAVALVASLLGIIVLRRWSAGKDLVARLYIRRRETEEALRKERKARNGGVGTQDDDLVRRGGEERDLHGTTFLISCVLANCPITLLVVSALATRGAQIILLLPKSHLGDLGSDDQQDEADPIQGGSGGTKLGETMQLLQLLRDGTGNERIYAEECDLQSLTSIEGFVKRWEEGEGGGGVGAGPAGGSMESGIGARSGIPSSGANGSADSGSDGMMPTGRAPRRCDGLVLLPYTLAELDAGQQQPGPEGRYEAMERELLGKFHLVNSLLSSLVLLPPERDIRIVHWISPWYAAGKRRFIDDKLRSSALSSGSHGTTATTSATVDQSLSMPPTLRSRGNSRDAQAPQQQRPKSTGSAPTRSQFTSSQSQSTVSTLGSATLTSILLNIELQRRLILLAEADPRPRNPLPGIYDPGQPSQISGVDANLAPPIARQPNVNVVNICPGFERINDVWQWTWPKSPPMQPGAAGLTVLPALLWVWLRRIAVILLWPIIWTFAKSPKAAVEQFVWAIVAPLNVEGGCQAVVAQTDGAVSDEIEVVDDDDEQQIDAAGHEKRGHAFGDNTRVPERGTQKQQKTKRRTTFRRRHLLPREPEEHEPHWRGVQPARLYREGRIVDVFGSAAMGNEGSGVGGSSGPLITEREELTKLWSEWERRVEEVRGGAIRRSGGYGGASR